MADWFDDDLSTDSTESFGFGGEESTSSDTNTTSTEETEPSNSGNKFGSFKERLGKKNFVLLLITLIGAAIIVVVSLVFGADPSKPKTNNSKSQVTQAPQQNVTKPVQTYNYADWKDMTGATFTTGAEKTAMFTITDYKLYARNSGGKVAPLEVRVEAWGAIAGYDGLYKIDVPYDLIAYIEENDSVEDEPISFQVTFKVGVYGDNKVIYDITP